MVDTSTSAADIWVPRIAVIAFLWLGEDCEWCHYTMSEDRLPGLFLRALTCAGEHCRAGRGGGAVVASSMVMKTSLHQAKLPHQ